MHCVITQYVQYVLCPHVDCTVYTMYHVHMWRVQYVLCPHVACTVHTVHICNMYSTYCVYVQ